MTISDNFQSDIIDYQIEQIEELNHLIADLTLEIQNTRHATDHINFAQIINHWLPENQPNISNRAFIRGEFVRIISRNRFGQRGIIQRFTRHRVVLIIPGVSHPIYRSFTNIEHIE